MVRAIRGALIECDAAVKQIILDLDAQEKFIIEDLDETHLFVDASIVERIKERLDEVLEENTYRINEF